MLSKEQGTEKGKRDNVFAGKLIKNLLLESLYSVQLIK
jgi:hypothetical protein